MSRQGAVHRAFTGEMQARDLTGLRDNDSEEDQEGQVKQVVI
jgi:hypothetical protein